MKFTTTNQIAFGCICLLLAAIFLGSELWKTNVFHAVMGVSVLLVGVGVLLWGRLPSPR